MAEQTKTRLQFSLQDVFVAILCLLGPMAWIQSLTFAFEDDRGTAYIAMLIGWVCGFLLAINYRRAWNSASAWYIPPFVFAGWSLALAPWALLTWLRCRFFSEWSLRCFWALRSIAT